MKTLLPLAALTLTLAACNNHHDVQPGTYVDLNTGDSVTVVRDSVTGYAMNAETKKPVYLYVDDKNDTIFTTGQRVNNMIVPIADGKYEVDGAKVKVDDNEVKIKYDDYKKKYGDGKYIVKDGDYKYKVDSDGDIKEKDDDGDYKRKVDADGDVKIKDGDTKTKIDKDGTVKTKKRHKIF